MKNTKKHAKKLKLSRKTVRKLAEGKLTGIAAAAGTVIDCGGPTGGYTGCGTC